MWSKLWDAFRHVAAIQKLLDLIGLWKIVSLGIAVLAAIAMGVWAWLAELRAPVIATICVVVLAAVMAAMNFGFNFYEKWKAKNPEAHWRVPLPLALVCGIVAILAALGWGSRFYLFQRSARQQDSVPSVVQKLARQWVESHPNSPTFVKDGEYASPEELGWINTRLMIDGMAPIPIPASVHPAPITAFKEDHSSHGVITGTGKLTINGSEASVADLDHNSTFENSGEITVNNLDKALNFYPLPR